MSVVSSQLTDLTGIRIPPGACVVLVRTEWNPDIVDKLEEGAIKILEEKGIHHQTIRVPGAVELGFAIKNFYDRNEAVIKEKPFAFIALGCVIRGATPHFEYVCNSAMQSVTQLNLSLPVPVIFGVLTVNHHMEATDRIGGREGHKGEEAAITAIKMMSLPLKWEA